MQMDSDDTHPVSDDDRYRRRLRAFENAAEQLTRQLIATTEGARKARRQADGSTNAVDIVLAVVRAGGPDERKHLHLLLRDFERSLQVLRGESFRILVESGSMTITHAARRVVLSAQMARRLYRVAEAEPLPPKEPGAAGLS